MTDKILEALNSSSLNKKNISFSEIRNIAGTNLGIWNELGRGRAILSTEEQLDQYLYSYGPMISSQWNIILEKMNFPKSDIQINDYACGQGLASLLFHDAFPGSNLSVINVNLIEPSVVALKRAKRVAECCFPNASVMTVNKLLDDVGEDDVVLFEGALKIHLFSNILDIDGFDQFKLLNKVLSTSGKHLIIVVSHDREHNGGSDRVRNTYETMLDEKHNDWYQIKDNDIAQFDCDNGQPTIAFYVDLEI